MSFPALSIAIRQYRHMKKILFILIMLSTMITGYSDNFITRGHQQGELYVASDWFTYLDTTTRAIFFTDDYGKTLFMKYYSGWSLSGATGMTIGRIVSDKNSEVVYNSQVNSLWRSDDYGYIWDSLQSLYQSPYPFISAGNKAGEFYCKLRKHNGDSIGLYLSLDFGEHFTFQSDSVYGNIEVGTTPGTIYEYGYHSIENIIYITYSTDYGLSFDTMASLNADSVGYGLHVDYPNLSRGINDGEIYLTTLCNSNRFRIYYSEDWGHSFSLRYESEIFDPFVDHYSFTAGTVQGSFYFARMTPLFEQGPNTRLCIYHSEDTANSFTEQCHILDTGFPVSIYNDDIVENKLGELLIYPNPVGSSTSVEFNVIQQGQHLLEVFSLSGDEVIRKKQNLVTGKQDLKMNTSHLIPGVYICSIRLNGKVVGVQKFIKGNH